MSSLSDIATSPYIPKKKVNHIWRGDSTDAILSKIFVPKENLLRIKKDKDGIPLRNSSDAKIKTILLVSAMSGGKSKLVDWIIKNGMKQYGEDNMHIRISRDIYSLIGRFDEKSGEFYGGDVSGKLVNFFVHEDSLSQLSRNAKKGIIETFDAIFNNTRHLVKYQDEYGNKKGLIVVILNIQDLHTLHPNCRKNWTMTVYKTLVKNEQNRLNFEARIPNEGLKILVENTRRLDDEDPDESWKSSSVVDFGVRQWGLLKSELVSESWSYDGSPYWIGTSTERSLDSDDNSSNQTTAITTGKLYSFHLLSSEILPLSILDKAWQYGKENPYPRAGRAKYKVIPHWKATYDYFVKEKAAGIICEGLGLTGDTMLTNGYNKGGYVAIVMREQLGHWIEPVIPEFIKDISWNVITGYKRTDLMDDKAFNSRKPGVGLFGEIKARRKKETPEDKWVSTEMAAHLKNGGKAFLYLLIIRRSNEKTIPNLITYRVEYIGQEIVVKQSFEKPSTNGNGKSKVLKENMDYIDKMIEGIEISDLSDIFN